MKRAALFTLSFTTVALAVFCAGLPLPQPQDLAARAIGAGLERSTLPPPARAALITPPQSRGSEDPRRAALRAFAHQPTPQGALEALRSCALLDEGFEPPRLKLAQHQTGAATLWYPSVEEDRWVIVTITKDGEEARLELPFEPAWEEGLEQGPELLKLESEEHPWLALTELEGGSGGEREFLRLFRMSTGRWIAFAELPLSAIWRSDEFPELCGADTPVEQREVSWRVLGDAIEVEGREQRVRRLGATPSEGIDLLRELAAVSERYAPDRQGKLQRIDRSLSGLATQRETLSWDRDAREQRGG